MGDTGTVAIRDLEEILTHLSAHQRPGRWCMISGVALPDTVVPAATIIEDEGTTSVVTVAQAQGLGVEPDFVAAWLTLDVNSALEAVGLTAAVAAGRLLPRSLAGARRTGRPVPVDPQRTGSITQVLTRPEALRL